MKNIHVAVLAAALLFSPIAFAKGKGGGTPQNHHCMKDGAEVAGKTKKDCIKDGGKWEKDAAAPAPPRPLARRPPRPQRPTRPPRPPSNIALTPPRP